MLAQAEMLLPLAFAVSGLMIVAAVVLLHIGTRQSRRADRLTVPDEAARAQAMTFDSSDGVVDRTDKRRPKRCETLQLRSGATLATLELMTPSDPARKRQRMYW